MNVHNGVPTGSRDPVCPLLFVAGIGKPSLNFTSCFSAIGGVGWCWVSCSLRIVGGMKLRYSKWADAFSQFQAKEASDTELKTRRSSLLGVLRVSLGRFFRVPSLLQSLHGYPSLQCFPVSARLSRRSPGRMYKRRIPSRPFFFLRVIWCICCCLFIDPLMSFIQNSFFFFFFFLVLWCNWRPTASA